MDQKEDNVDLVEQVDSKRPYPRLDYTITDIQKRNQKVHEIVNSISPERLHSKEQ